MVASPETRSCVEYKRSNFFISFTDRRFSTSYSDRYSAKYMQVDTNNYEIRLLVLRKNYIQQTQWWKVGFVNVETFDESFLPPIQFDPGPAEYILSEWIILIIQCRVQDFFQGGRYLTNKILIFSSEKSIWVITLPKTNKNYSSALQQC